MANPLSPSATSPQSQRRRRRRRWAVVGTSVLAILTFLLAPVALARRTNARAAVAVSDPLPVTPLPVGALGSLVLTGALGGGLVLSQARSTRRGAGHASQHPVAPLRAAVGPPPSRR